MVKSRFIAYTLAATLLYIAGVATATTIIVCHGTTIAEPLFLVAAWLSNATTGPVFTVSVEPQLQLATDPPRPVTQRRKK